MNPIVCFSHVKLKGQVRRWGAVSQIMDEFLSQENIVTEESPFDESTLFVMLQRLIGRKSDHDNGLSFLGISTIIVEVKLLGIGSPLKNSCIASVTSLPMMSQHT